MCPLLKQKTNVWFMQDITDREKSIRQELENANAYKVMTKELCQLDLYIFQI